MWVWVTSPGSEYGKDKRKGPGPAGSVVGDDRRPRRAPGKVGWNQEAMVSWKLVMKVLKAGGILIWASYCWHIKESENRCLIVDLAVCWVVE